MWNLKRAMPYAHQEEALSESGRRGQAEVVTARVTGTVGDGPSRLEWGTYRFLLRVTPEGGEATFEVRLHMRLPGNVSGEVGTRFPVLFDAKNHEFMIVDPSVVPRSKEELVTAKLYAPGLQDLLGGTGLDSDALVEQARERWSDGAQSAIPPPRVALSVQSRIEQLDQLKAAGLIDDAQYQAKMQKLTKQL